MRCEITASIAQAMLPRALVADGSGNASIRGSTDGKAGRGRYAAHTHKLPKVSRLAILFFFSISRPRFVQRLASERGGGGQKPPEKPSETSLSSSCRRRGGRSLQTPAHEIQLQSEFATKNRSGTRVSYEYELTESPGGRKRSGPGKRT